MDPNSLQASILPLPKQCNLEIFQQLCFMSVFDDKKYIVQKSNTEFTVAQASADFVKVFVK